MLYKMTKESKRPQIYQESVTNNRVVEQIKGVHPAFAKHMFLRNRIIESFARWQYGGIDLLDLPVCGSCEKPGAWHDSPPGSCYCAACGKVTAKTMTLRDYMAQELKEFKEEHLEELERIVLEAYPINITEVIDNVDKQTGEGRENVSA